MGINYEWWYVRVFRRTLLISMWPIEKLLLAVRDRMIIYYWRVPLILHRLKKLPDDKWYQSKIFFLEKKVEQLHNILLKKKWYQNIIVFEKSKYGMRVEWIFRKTWKICVEDEFKKITKNENPDAHENPINFLLNVVLFWFCFRP